MLWNVAVTLSESSEWHSHEIFEFVLCHAGSGLVVTDQQCIGLVGRRTILLTPQVRHRFVFRRGESADLKIICMTPLDIGVHLAPAQTSALQRMNQAGVTFTDHPDLWGRLSEVLEMIPEGLHCEDQGELQMAWGALALLLAGHQRGQCIPDKAPKAARHLNAIQNVCEWIEAHLDQKADLDELASRFGLSRSLLTREFRRHTGASVVDYLNTRRLQKVGALLAASDKSIAEAAFECGFSSLTNFYRRFKVLYGVTPVEFRKFVENTPSLNAGDTGGCKKLY